MEFETVLKILVSVAGTVAIPVAAYAAIAATRSIWGKAGRSPDDETAAELSALRARVQEMEAMQARMAELEERVDFAERLLVQHRESARLPEEAR